MQVSKLEIEEIIRNAVRCELKEGVKLPAEEIEKSIVNGLLQGPGSNIDSLAMLTIIDVIQDKVNQKYKTNIDLASTEVLSQTEIPFTTIQSLTNFLESLIVKL